VKNFTFVLMLASIEMILQLGISGGAKGLVEKVVLECESLLEQSGNPASRGFRVFLKSRTYCTAST